MDKYKLLYAELKQYNIDIKHIDLKGITSFTIKLGNKYYIAINSKLDLTLQDKYWILEHELEHIKNGSFYSIGSSDYEVNAAEQKVNDALIKKLSLDKKMLLLLLDEKTDEEIKNELDISDSLLNDIKPYSDKEFIRVCYEYLKERGFFRMENRSLLLCMKHGIETAEEYALKIGTTIETALSILNETCDMIDHKILMRNCEIFNVSREYFLCLTENER